MANFEEIIGYEGIKNELRRICDIIKNSDKYDALGVTMPAGLLLYGDVGVGKTTMAKCFLGEIGWKYYICRKNKPDGEFVNEIKRVFDEAGNNEPSLILLDDMDKYANEDECHKNADEFVTIQTCIDDIKGKNVFVIATANYLSDIPDSLLRMGRFDKTIRINNPKGKEAEDIVRFYLSKKKYMADIDAAEISRILEGKSCAELETVINEAGIYAGFAGKTCIEMEDIVEACLRIIYKAPEGLIIDNDYDEGKIAYHEAGHAVIAEILTPGSVNLVSVSGQRSDMGGVCSYTRPEGYFSSKEKMEDRVTLLLGGKAATETLFGITDTGANSDIHRAFNIVERFADDYCSYGFDAWIQKSDTCDRIKENRDMRMAMDMERLFQRAKKILTENRTFLQAVAERLAEKKILTGNEVRTIREEVNRQE